MKYILKIFCFCVSILGFFALNLATASSESDCQRKAKALVLLETAEELLSKAAIFHPPCREETDSRDGSQCNEKTSLAYIDISKKLIAGAKHYFPGCPAVIGEQLLRRDCAEILASGANESGVYTIWPSESNAIGNPLQVYCDMETDGGGWTVIQRRGKFTVQQDFNQNWESYKLGFGNITEEFWLGNENIRVLCHKVCEIRFDLQDHDGNKGFAVYKSFTLIGSNYTLNISDYTGNVGHCMDVHNGFDFSTEERGASISIAKMRGGGWWYGGVVTFANLNGVYKPGSSGKNTVYWLLWRLDNNLDNVEIKVRQK